MSKFLPEWVAPDGEITRPTASEINELAPQQQTVTVAGYNEPVPFVYGQQQVGGPIIAGPVSLLSNRSLVFAVALCRSGARRIESVDAVMINGVDQGAMPDINVNPTVVSKSSINFRIYNGTQIREDDTLKAALGAGFEDYFPETAYAVITVPVAQANDFNIASSIIWTIKGRRCLDPRTNTYSWTENPSLHLADFVTCQKYGLDREIIGVEACADWNDSLYNGLPRARTGLVLNEALEEHQVLDLMSTYAECLWSYEGRAIRIIADAPVESPVAIITKDQIREGTVTISGANQANFPTALSIIFSDRSRPEEWGSIPAHVQSTDHDVYGSIGSQSDLSLLGVYRRVEADRRAWSRFMRLQVPGKISFQMFDDGISFQTGDVIQLPDYMGLRGVVVRIISRPDPVDVGLYQIHTEIYKNSFYPEGIDGVAVPAGGLTLFDGVGIPEFHEIAYTGEDIPIVGSAASGGVLAELSPPTGAITGSISGAGAHTGSPISAATANYTNSSGGSDTYRIPGFITADPVPSHSHGVSINLTSYRGVYLRDIVTLRALKKVTDSGGSAFAPIGTVFFLDSDISAVGIQPLASLNSTIHVGNSPKTTAARLVSEVHQTSSVGDHRHDSAPTLRYAIYNDGGTARYFYALGPAGAHSHSVLGGDIAYQNLKEKGVVAYKVVANGVLVPTGAVIGFDGPTIPAGWSLCDGSNGTPDLVDFFVRASSVNNEGVEFGSENKIRINGLASSTSTDGAHSHPLLSYYGTFFPNTRKPTHDASTGGHAHSVSSSVAFREFNYTPKRFGIRFIKYTGE